VLIRSSSWIQWVLILRGGEEKGKRIKRTEGKKAKKRKEKGADEKVNDEEESKANGEDGSLLALRRGRMDALAYADFPGTSSSCFFFCCCDVHTRFLFL